MPRGDCQREFAEAAAADGIVLGKQSFTWLCQRGHLALPEESESRRALTGIFDALGGNIEELSTAPPTRLTGDFLHDATGTLIEIDERQHFTSARLATLDLYPAETPLGFEREHYRSLCLRNQAAANRAFAHRAARGFGPGGRQQQRAYYDALRDLASPAMGHPPLIRIDAVNGNGAAAYRAHRERLLSALA